MKIPTPSIIHLNGRDPRQHAVCHYASPTLLQSTQNLNQQQAQDGLYKLSLAIILSCLTWFCDRAGRLSNSSTKPPTLIYIGKLHIHFLNSGSIKSYLHEILF